MTDAHPRLSLMVFSGDFARVHYTLVIASAAAATNVPVTVFFTMKAAHAVLSSVAGRKGWHDLSGEDGRSAVKTDSDYMASGVAGFEELISACAELGVRFMVCEMGLRSLGLEGVELRGDLEITPGGVVSFLADAGDEGRIIFI
jgi:peroxiredoxin family protein